MDRCILYLVDKPFADCATRLRLVAEASEKHGVFSTLTLPNRTSKIVADGSLGQLVLYSSRLNNGSPIRYDPTPSSWHNIPSVSGGWASPPDTFLQFVDPEPITLVGAVMSNAMCSRQIEDSAVGMLRSDGSVTGIIESGYTFPSRARRSDDHFFRFIGSKTSVFAFYNKAGEPLIKVNTSSGTVFEEDLGHGERMRKVINEGLSALQEGQVPETNILDDIRILEIQYAVYDHAQANPLTDGLHPMEAAAAKP